MLVKSTMLSVAATFLIATSPAIACSRVTYVGPDNIVLTGRPMEIMFSSRSATEVWRSYFVL